MPCTPMFHDYRTSAALDEALAAFVAARLDEALALRGVASLALSGGRTPAGFLRLLGTMPLDWKNITVTLADERWVDETHPDSNARLLQETLLTGPAAAARFVPLYNGTSSPATGQSECEANLANLPWPLDVVVLGMGQDGHTASLFPQAPQLQHALTTSARCAAITPVTAEHERMTLSLAALANARCLIVHLTGADKCTLLDTMLAQTAGETAPPLPLRRVLDAHSFMPHVFRAP